jgi:hypothetical protein
MGVAWVAYRMTYMAPGEVHGIYLHPFPYGQFIQFDLRVSHGNTPAFHPSVQLEVLAVDEHVDGKAYHLRFTNRSVSRGGRPTPFVELLAYAERVR